MDCFTIELVSNASFNCYRNNSIGCFTIFLPEQIHLKGNGRLLFQKYYSLFLYQNVTEGKFIFVYGRKNFEEERKMYQCILNQDCIQIFLIKL